MCRLIALFLAAVTVCLASSPPDSADYVRQNVERLKDSSHVIQIAYVNVANERDKTTTWVDARTAHGYTYTGSIPCSVPNDLLDRFVRKYGVQSQQGRKIATWPLRALVRKSDNEVYLEVTSMYFTD
jgi:hypothetical protein